MATKNLTRKFVDLRAAAKASRLARGIGQASAEENLSDSELLASGQSSSNWKGSNQPKWIEKIEVAEGDISRIQSKMRELAGLHSKRLMVNFEADEASQEREIDIMTQDITEIFRHAELCLKQFSHQGDETKISSQEFTVRNNMQRSMAKKLQGLSMQFRTSQKEYLTRLQNQKSGTTAFDFLEQEKKRGVVEDNGFSREEMLALESTSQLVDQRDEEITKIARSIEELAQIFKELAVLVIDQGTILDRIDYNMEQVIDHTKEGIEQLKEAEEYQKSALPVKCIIILVVLIAIMCGALILKHTTFSK